MVVVFLDIDGVICTRKAAGWPPWKATPPRRLPGVVRMRPLNRPARAMDRTAVERLNNVVEATGAVVVISSNWRLDIDLDEIVRRTGITATIHADWRTDADGPTRGHEIERWLHAHGDPIFAIVDDKAQVRDHHRRHLVLTRYHDGFQSDHAAALMELLTDATSKLIE